MEHVDPEGPSGYCALVLLRKGAKKEALVGAIHFEGRVCEELLLGCVSKPLASLTWSNLCLLYALLFMYFSRIPTVF